MNLTTKQTEEGPREPTEIEIQQLASLIEVGDVNMIRYFVDMLKIQVDNSHPLIAMVYDSRNMSAGEKYGIHMNMVSANDPEEKNDETQMNLTTEQLQKIIKEEFENVVAERASKKARRKKKRKAKKKKAKKAKKRDACYHKVKSRYKVWPSAYASGALVKCRNVGAKNWGNKSKKNESLNESEGEFKPHMMYDPKTGKSEMAKKREDHERLAKKGYIHVDPDELRDILDDEGGAAGLEPLVKGTKSSDKEVKAALKDMPDVGKHKKGDYIKADDKEVEIVKEQKKNCGCGQDPCKTYGIQEQVVTEDELEEKKKKPCKKAKGKKFVKRVNGKCRSFGQAGKAKDGGARIRPGTKKGHAFCARTAKIKKCKNPPCANDLSRKKWKCRGSRSVPE